MSKMMDKLRAALRGEQVRMGFGSRNAISRPPGIGLIADLADNLDLAEGAAEFADALIIAVRPDDAKQAATAAGTAIWGMDAGKLDATEAILTDAGADFVVLSDNSEASAIRSSEVGKLLRISASAPDGILRVLAGLPIEAILPDQPATGRFKVSELLDFLRIGALSGKPMILTIGSDFEPSQLVSLRDAGVAAVSMQIRSKRDLDSLKVARETIAAFPMPPKKGRDSNSAMVSVARPNPQQSENETTEIDE